MTRTLHSIALLSALAYWAGAAEWYAATNGSYSGNGSIAAPWPLSMALTNPAGVVAPGDTINLRGGAYLGPFVSTLSGTAFSYITVRSAPFEWAVISDGITGTLLTDMPATNGGTAQWITIAGSEMWGLMDVVISNEVVRLNIKNGTNWYAVRGWVGSPSDAHGSNSTIRAQKDIFTQNGSYVAWRDFEITSQFITNRYTPATNACFAGFVAVGGVGNKLINLVVHDVGHPGIGFWRQGAGAEVNGCLVWGNGLYDYGATMPRGSAIYSQNEAGDGMVYVKNNVSFRNFTTGGKVYGETGPVNDFAFVSNTVFQCPTASLEASSGSSTTSNTWFNGNTMLGPPLLRYQSRSNSAQFFINNTLLAAGFIAGEHTDSTYTNNTTFLIPNGSAQVKYSSADFATNQLNITWDYNTYYLTNSLGTYLYDWNFGAAGYTTTNALGGGVLKFNNDSGKSWIDWSGFDAHSTLSTEWPTDFQGVEVKPYDYDENRWNITVVNIGHTNVDLDLATLGFQVGYTFSVVDVQNWPAVISSGTYNGTTISIPLTLTNIATTKGAVTNRHTNVEYPALLNAFVLTRSANRYTHTHGSGTLGSSTR